MSQNHWEKKYHSIEERASTLLSPLEGTPLYATQCAQTDFDPCHEISNLLWCSNFVNSDLHGLINNSDPTPYTKLCGFPGAYCDYTFSNHFCSLSPRTWGHVGSLYAPGTGKVGSPVEKKEIGVTGQSIMSYVVYSINDKKEKERENMVFVKVFSCLVFFF